MMENIAISNAPQIPDDLNESTRDEFLKDTAKWMKSAFAAFSDINTSITQGWLIDDARITSLEVGTLFANNAIIDDLQIGNDANGSITLSGSTDTIEVDDDNGQLRVKIGKLGSGSTEWGIQVYDSSGNLEFSSSSVMFIDGLIIEDGSIVGTDKLQANSISTNELQANSVTATEINVSTLSAISANVGTLTAGTINSTVAINAAAINTGTLTADGSPAIVVTGAGALLMQSGGDIQFRSSATDYSAALFESSGGTTIGQIQLNGSASSPTGLTINANGTNKTMIVSATGSGSDVLLSASDEIRVNTNIASTSSVVQFDDAIGPDTDEGHACGTALRTWSDVVSALINGSDIVYDNLWIKTEANYVWDGVEEDEGIATIDNENNILRYETKDVIYDDRPILPMNQCPHIGKNRGVTISEKRRLEGEGVKFIREGDRWFRSYKKKDGKVYHRRSGVEMTPEEIKKIEEFDDRSTPEKKEKKRIAKAKLIL